MAEAQAQAQAQAQQQPEPQTRRVALTEVPVNGNENLALNLMVSFLGVAQSRGAFTLDEASKIVECVNVFRKEVAAPTPAPASTQNVKLETVEEESN